MAEMLTPTPRICLHADVDGDPTRCPCALPLPPGIEVDDDWQLADGHVLRVLKSEGEIAWVFATQRIDGSLHDAVVVHPFLDDLNAADARRIGQALLKAAAQLDSLLSPR
jgi:hypothetical protein